MNTINPLVKVIYVCIFCLILIVFSLAFSSSAAAESIVQISAGGGHNCMLKGDGTVVCWGKNDYGQSSPPTGTFTQVSAGSNHTCGLKGDGTVVCWGSNDFGQSSPPNEVFMQISAGQSHTCGIRLDTRNAECWGSNVSWQSTPPTGIFTQISAGGHHTCGFRDPGGMVCWGSDSAGQVTPPATITYFTQVDAGSVHTCGLLYNFANVVCWGFNNDGEASPPTGTFSQVSAGLAHTCGLRTDSTVACWGLNSVGQSTPPSGTFTQVSAGGYHSCGLRTNGTVACWGWNVYGQATPPGIDTDGDGVNDDVDAFPNDPSEWADTDLDGVGDNSDIAPTVYNPDQSDLDGDGIADVLDGCPNDATNTCDPDGSAATYIDSTSGGTLTTADGTVNIEIPPGATTDGSVSITDTDSGSSGFELTTNLGNVLGVFSVDLQPSQTFAEPVAITFSWDDVDNDGFVDGTNIKEENLIVTKDNVVITDKCKREPPGDGTLPDCDMDANTFSFEVNGWSEFVLASANDPVVTSIDIPVDPVNINNLPTIIGSFTDADDDDSHSAVWDWGNSTTSVGVVNQIDNTVSGTPSYTEAGVYQVVLTITDAFPNSGSMTSTFLVVYAPEEGFVTGGGWFVSPAGALTADPTLTSKASFGYVSRYKKGSTVPTGNTEFQFKIADLSFHSSRYDWLVVTGSDFAKFKGTGAINGEGEYKFQIWAGDGTGPAGEDAFRIKIWYEDGVGNEVVVYDNGFESSGFENGQPISGGNIVVHSK